MSTILEQPKKDHFFTETREPRWWTLYYRYSNIPQLTKGFCFDGKLNEAILRGRRHCDIMGYLFICVRPMIVDLDFQEQSFKKAQEEGAPVGAA